MVTHIIACLLGYFTVALAIHAILFIVDFQDSKHDALPLPVIAILWPLFLIISILVGTAIGIASITKHLYYKKFLVGLKNKYASWRWRKKNAKAFDKQKVAK